MSIEVIVTFVLYLIVLMGIGLYFYRRNVSIEDYLLGGRGMGSWVTALSAQASDMSGWLLMALPGAIYLGGLSKSWIAIGLFVGTVFNWYLVSGRLRLYTELTGTITLPCFFEKRFRDPTGLLRIVSASVILVFFTIYATSGLVAAGKLFESVFGMGYEKAVITGGIVIVGYTFLGGFLAVCWTDLFQGLLMVVAILVVPWVGFRTLGSMETIHANMSAAGVSLSMIPPSLKNPVVAIISALAWGLGYFGQPHILTRFMSVERAGRLGRSMRIAIIWVFLSLTGACAAGLVGIGLLPGLSGGEEEKVFIYLIEKLFSPWVAGVLLAAILSAIMSTIDSQLLVSSSALTEDFYEKMIRKDSPQKQTIAVGRICVILISVIAVVLALRPNDTILGIVAYAWAGFGSAFGPVVLFALLSRKTTWISALAGMTAGTVVLIVWKQVGLDGFMYEIVPGFVSNCLTIFVIDRIVPQTDSEILDEFEKVSGEASRIYV